MRVSFFLAGEADLPRLRSLDPDRDWQELHTGERAWVLQTYLRLARAGRPVELTAAPPATGVVLFHAKQSRELLRFGERLRGNVLVGIRADNRPSLIADLEIVQDPTAADGGRRRFLPHWPQPGLVPRDSARGAGIARIAYKGFAANLHPDFLAPAWRDFLAGLGIRWEVQAVPFAGPRTDVGGVRWPDFREVDLVLAVRPPRRDGWPSKPPTKLFNAWLAGVPALLGPEVAYRELRRSELDYAEVAGLAAAQAAVERLRAEPERYRAMIENGRRRAEEFRPGATLERWITFFETVAAPLLAGAARRPPILLRRLAGRSRRLLGLEGR